MQRADLGVPAVAGRAIPNEIARACTAARYPGNYATFSGAAQDYRSRIGRKVRELAGLPMHAESFVDFQIVRDSDCTPRLVFGNWEFDHVLRPDDAALFEARALTDGNKGSQLSVD